MDPVEDPGRLRRSIRGLMMNTATAITNEEYLWQTTLVALECRFTKPIFETWIKPMRVLGLSTDEITLTVQNQFAKDWAENRFKGTISAALSETLGAPISIRFVIDEAAEPAESRTLPADDVPDSAPHGAVAPAARPHDDFRQTGLNPRYTFEQFVVGATN